MKSYENLTLLNFWKSFHINSCTNNFYCLKTFFKFIKNRTVCEEQLSKFSITMNKSSATQFCFKDTKNERKKERHAFRDSYKILKVENVFLLLCFGHDNYLILRTDCNKISLYVTTLNIKSNKKELLNGSRIVLSYSNFRCIPVQRRLNFRYPYYDKYLFLYADYVRYNIESELCTNGMLGKITHIYIHTRTYKHTTTTSPID